ncbi:dihydromonapterin reductase [Alteromonas sediminis]|uniref:Dihydromonapterin reductase n=1 Tax=Alteromonas sediminis TaxID=2259342 RepID=A0A3N5Y9E7_9ALTE|nr:dihydromonapterin reductase [Alteromonas sediminis]RPJ65235.1 dihydromonapterin reductase [Alteromonas sediminis]
MTSPILLTGGTQRLGLAIAEMLLDKGETLIITYRTAKPAVDLLAKKGATMIQCDFQRQEDIESLIAQVRNQAPVLKCIIHNASDWDAEKDNLASPEILQKMMQVHVNAPYLINWALEGNLRQFNGFADIIHMTDYVQETGSAKHVAYAASKAALHNLTLSFAKKLAPDVKVNSIAPALVMFNEWDDDAYREKSQKKSLLEKVPGAIEAVKAVEYLLNSDYVTGQTLHLNGGRHLK